MTVAILLSALLAFALGYLWYSPKMFGNAWRDAVGKKPEELVDTSRALHAVSIIGWLAAAFVYALLSTHPMIQGSVKDYMFLSIALWGAFMMPAKSAALLHGNFNTKLIWIDGGYHLAGYLIFALVFRLMAS